jgi:class 3 adenylate cyclase/tetratricopeptide (TPR) repeat protein
VDLPPITCSNCGTPNDADRKFCAECGSRLGVACAVCGSLNPASAKFCGECGSPTPALAASSPAEARGRSEDGGPPTAERRLVSVLFADLVGFTTLSEERDPEETRELLTRYFEIARETIERHGGTVEKFIGDAVMAVWGAPVAHEDDAERAVRAALELVAAVPSIGEGELPLQARAGVLTGEAAVTIGAQGQGMVAGDLVNTASRLQSVAPPGTTLVGEATYRATSTSIAYEPAGEQALKGKAAPVPAWRATAVVARRGGSGRAAILEPPFVGREDELRLLKDLFDATARERKSRLVTVVGQAGIGKSRLAWEFEKYLDGVIDTAYWHEGRSPAYGEGISYWALAEMVRRRAGIAEGDDDATARRRLAGTLDEFVTDAAERRWIEPRLAGLLGLAELPTEGREELYAAWRTFFERLAEVAPVILVFTDLQWADLGMLDFVEALLRWARTAPILVVALARPDLLERRPEFGSGVRSLTRINLEPLPDEEMQRLLEGLVPGLPGPAVRSIIERAEGIPLYAVETVRMLVDRDLLVTNEDGGYRLTGELPRLGVAETLHALIASRLDANRPVDRAVLLDASVLGQSFTVEALKAVAGDPPDLSDRLDRLVRRELLQVEADPRSPERGQYQFVQALVREVAYQNLAKADRRARHLAAARHFEALENDELAGVLASHYLSAYEASRPGPEADAVAAQARIALQAAAERAASLHSHRQALNYLDQALTVTKDPGEQAVLHERAAESGEAAGDVRGAIRHAQQTRELHRSLGDERGALRAATWLGRHQTSAKLQSQAVATLEGALAEAGEPGDWPEHAAALAELSRVYMLTGRHSEAIATADRAMELGDRHRLVWPVVEALVNKGTALENTGRAVEAEGVLRGAIVVAERNGLPLAALRARNNLFGTVMSDDQRDAIALAREGYDLAVRVGHQPFMLQFLAVLFDLAIRVGSWGEWLSEIEAVEEAETPDVFFQAWFAGQRATLGALHGDIEAAEVEAAKMKAMAATMESQMVAAAVALTGATLKFVAADWGEASRLAMEAAQDFNFVDEASTLAAHAAVAGDLRDDLAAAIDQLRQSPFRGRSTQAAMIGAEAGFAAREGQWDEARAGYRQAIETLEQTGYLQEKAITSLEWGALAGDRDPEAQAAGAWGEAYFLERDAGLLVERYRAGFVPVEAAPVAGPSSSRAARSGSEARAQS